MTMTDLELSFQFPIKRDGASPVVLVASVTAGVSSGVADSVSSGAADSVAVGAAMSSLSLLELVITIAPTNRIPSSTAKRTFDDDLLLELVADFEEAAGSALAAEVRGAAGAGVVETFTRGPPIDGTGGMMTCDAIFLRAADFFTVFLPVDFLATFFFTTVFFTALFGALFFAALFLAGVFLVTLFLVVFLTALFLVVDFFGAAFFAADFFFTATVVS